MLSIYPKCIYINIFILVVLNVHKIAVGPDDCSGARARAYVQSTFTP